MVRLPEAKTNPKVRSALLAAARHLLRLRGIIGPTAFNAISASLNHAFPLFQAYAAAQPPLSETSLAALNALGFVLPSPAAVDSEEDANVDAEGEDDDDDGQDDPAPQKATEGSDEDEVMDVSVANAPATLASSPQDAAPAAKRRKTEVATTPTKSWVFRGNDRVGVQPGHVLQQKIYLVGPFQCANCTSKNFAECAITFTEKGETKSCTYCHEARRGACRYSRGGGPSWMTLTSSRSARKQLEVIVPQRTASGSSSKPGPTRRSPAKASSSLPPSSSTSPTKPRPKPLPKPSAAIVPSRTPSQQEGLPAPLLPPATLALPPSFTRHRAPTAAPSPAVSQRTLSTSSSWAIPAFPHLAMLEQRYTEALNNVETAEIDVAVAQAALESARKQLAIVSEALESARGRNESTSSLNLDLGLQLRDDPDTLRHDPPTPADEPMETDVGESKGKGKGRAT